MNLENGPSKEAPKVKLTREQFDKIRTTPVADMKDLEVRAFQAEIGPLGLGVGAGTVKVEVDGEIFHMNTQFRLFWRNRISRSRRHALCFRPKGLSLIKKLLESKNNPLGLFFWVGYEEV